MKGKGKAKVKSPKKDLLKATIKNEVHSLNIAEMFKKQTDRKSSKSENKNSIDITDDDDDVIFVEENEVSPYFSKRKATSSTTNLQVKKSSSYSSTCTDSHSVKKRKLSLSRNTNKLNSYSGTILCDDTENEDKKCIFSLIKATSDKLGETGKQNIDTRPVDFESHNEGISSLENTFKLPFGNNNSICELAELIVGSPTSNTSGTSFVSLNDMDVDISYSPVLPKDAGSVNNKSTLKNDTSIGCKNGTEESVTDVTCIKQICDTVDKKDKGTLIVDDNSENEDNVSISEPKLDVPYYLTSFETILQTVMEDETNRTLFNDDDMHSITKYQTLSDAAKKLYIRMFGRKLNWIPLNKLNYHEIAEDLKPYLQELAEAKFIDCDENLTDLEEVLNALSANDVKTLAKSYHIISNISQKKQLVLELLKKSQQCTLTTMFKYAGGDVAQVMLTRAKKYLNGIYKLKAAPRGVFVRVMMLFSLVNTLYDEDSRTGGQGQLFQMLMVNLGKLVYPTYTIEKVHNVFQDREDLIRFENTLQLESDLLHCIERGSWDKAYSVFLSIQKEWNLLEANKSIEEWNRNLPDFLRCYTATSVIYSLLSASVEILQRRKDYVGAIELLRKLLSQTIYKSSHRGYWWERLALNLDAHMKQPLESLQAVQNGLADSHVRVGHRLALYLRAENICQRPKLKLQNRLKDFHHETVKETPKVYIEGRVLHQGVSTNGTRFLTEKSYTDGNSQDMTVMGVEEFVLDYYKRNGFPSGIHAEGSIVSTLFTLFFWDVLFMAVPDAFHSPFQSMPLDLHSNMFYDRRKSFIEERLSKLKSSSVQELQALVEETWTSQQGVLCAGINWERMSLDSIKELLSCMGGEVLSGIIGRCARCPRHTRSGFPDLTLWNIETGALKICEVKGPGDRLSHKQILWIDYLLSLGVDAEVCHVKAVAAKKLKPS